MDLITKTNSEQMPSSSSSSSSSSSLAAESNQYYYYYNLNNQLKFDLEQQNAIKLQQLEAIKLIQISLDKLSTNTTVPFHSNNKQQQQQQNGSTQTPTILVYKETNLHKNLLVSKILNKSKFVYYQSIVQTMRLSLMSKLNYYNY